MANLAAAAASPQSLFMDYYDRIQGIIRQRCWNEESRQNALAWAWSYFLDFVDGAEHPRQAAIAAATFGCRRGGRPFGKPPRSGYVDTWDHAERLPLGDTPATTAEPAADRTWTIDEMPPRLRMVAKCLEFGLNRTETADKLGCCTYTVLRRVDEIARWIRDREPGRYAR